MLYGNARRHRRIGEAGIEEMETRKHSSSLLRIQVYAAVRARLRNYFQPPYCAFRNRDLSLHPRRRPVRSSST